MTIINHHKKIASDRMRMFMYITCLENSIKKMSVRANCEERKYPFNDYIFIVPDFMCLKPFPPSPFYKAKRKQIKYTARGVIVIVICINEFSFAIVRTV